MSISNKNMENLLPWAGEEEGNALLEDQAWQTGLEGCDYLQNQACAAEGDNCELLQDQQSDEELEESKKPGKKSKGFPEFEVKEPSNFKERKMVDDLRSLLKVHLHIPLHHIHKWKQLECFKNEPGKADNGKLKEWLNKCIKEASIVIMGQEAVDDFPKEICKGGFAEKWFTGLVHAAGEDDAFHVLQTALYIIDYFGGDPFHKDIWGSLNHKTHNSDIIRTREKLIDKGLYESYLDDLNEKSGKNADEMMESILNSYENLKNEPYSAAMTKYFLSAILIIIYASLYLVQSFINSRSTSDGETIDQLNDSLLQ